MLIAERFISRLIKTYELHPIISTDEGTWYLQTCQFLKLKHYIHLLLRKALLKEQYNITISKGQDQRML